MVFFNDYIMNKRIPEIKDNLDELESRLQKEKDSDKKQRIHMLVLLKSSQACTRKEVAKHLAVHRNTIGDWLTKYETNGIDGLLEIKPLGQPKGQRSLADDVLSSLKQRLEDPSGFGSYIELKSWLTETHGVSIKYHTLYRSVLPLVGGTTIVHYEQKAKPKVPRRSHIKKLR
jgi:transposase